MLTADYVEKRKREKRERDEAERHRHSAVLQTQDEIIDAGSSVNGVEFAAEETLTLMGVVELILKHPPRLEKIIRDPSLQPQLMPLFLLVSLMGFTFFGVALAVVMSSLGVWPSLQALADVIEQQTRLITFASSASVNAFVRPWFDGSAFNLILAYNLGLIAATGICLPSLYFYGLLSGIRMSMLDVTIHSLKSKATAAIALVGILPIYAALCMGMVIFEAPELLVNASLWLGLVLPFIAGLWGTRSLYLGLAGLSDTIEAERRCKRECFLRRLVFSWAVCYTAVTPVMIYTLWEYLDR